VAGLTRRLGVADAVVIGLGSMIGAGVFVAWSPAAAAAGDWLLLGLLIAGAVALCNAMSSAQLAACHPESGGTYVYARERLGPAWGHLAGWGFVVGKTASTSAMAMAVGAYVWPEQRVWVATAAVLLIVLVNLGGLSRTVAVTRVLLAVSSMALAVVIVGGLTREESQVVLASPVGTDPLGVLRSAGFLFFAFAGYARVATLGEEVRDPAVTIPKAIPRALLAVLAVYLVVGASALRAVPAGALALDDAPLAAVVRSGSLAGLTWVVTAGAAVASLGVLLNLIPGVSRTVLAMARRSELPRWFAAIDERRSLPVRAELSVAAVTIVLVHTLSITSSIAVSGAAVLMYYALTNLSALRLAAHERRWHPAIAAGGLVGCLVLVAALPLEAILGGLVVIVAGVLVRIVTSRSIASS
jgi:APA family basic amino acid/polyamine antiporter